MPHSKECRKIWSNVRDRLLFVLMTTGTLLLFALPVFAASKDASSTPPRFSLLATPDPFEMPESVDVQVPSHVSPEMETGLIVFVSVPTGCFRSRILVDHLDDFTHRLTPVLIRDAKDCIQYSKVERQVVSLGKLLAGQHSVEVDNTIRPVETKAFWVNQEDLSASNGRLQRQTGG